MAKRKRASVRGYVPADADLIAARIAGYRPKGVPAATWAAVAAFVKDATTRSKPQSINSVYMTARAITDVVVWAFERGMPLDIEALFDVDSIEHFTSTQMRHLKEHSAASYRSALRRLARSITKKAAWPADDATYSRSRSDAPFSSDDITWLRSIATAQKTDTRRRAAMTVLCLAYGAGLRGPEFGTLTGADIDTIHGHPVVNIRGAYPRRIPVLPEVADDLLALAAQYPDRPFFSDRTPVRGWVSQVLSLVEVPQSAPAFSVIRMRTTWRVKLHTAGIRLSELADLAGVETIHTWAELVQWVPRRDFDDVRRIIGGIDG